MVSVMTVCMRLLAPSVSASITHRSNTALFMIAVQVRRGTPRRSETTRRGWHRGG